MREGKEQAHVFNENERGSGNLTWLRRRSDGLKRGGFFVLLRFIGDRASSREKLANGSALGESE